MFTFSSSFYEIEIKALLEWSLYRFLEKKLPNEYGWLKEERNISTEVYSKGNSMKFNSNDVWFFKKNEGDRLCKKVEAEDVGKPGYATRIMELRKKGIRTINAWDSSKDVYQTIYGDSMYEIHFEKFHDGGQLLKIVYESDEKPRVEDHALFMRKLAVEIGVNPIPPSQFQYELEKYNKRLRHTQH